MPPSLGSQLRIIQEAQIWEAIVPFADSENEKSRPVLILGWTPDKVNDDFNILILPITTFGGDKSKATAGDYEILDTASARLEPGSFVRMRRLMTRNPSAFDFSDRGYYGVLNPSEYEYVLKEVSELFGNGMTTL